MSDDRKEGVNLLNPEMGSREQEANFEAQEISSESALQSQEAPQVDKQQLSAMKSTITAQAAVTAAPEKDPAVVQIESILSENLGEIYSQLPEDKREAFRLKGEEIAGAIHQMIKAAKVKAHSVLKLITEWLRLIPGVNVYFLQQEAKIKMDKILDYAEEQAKSLQDSM